MKGDGAGIAEATDAAERAEVVIEGAVLLHHEDDVLDIGDGAGAIVGGDCQRSRDAGGKGSGNGACT
jgi:hypothetical protein